MGEAKLRSRIRTEIDNVAQHKALQGYEIPREFAIARQPFTKANHLLTDSSKMARGQLKKRYLCCQALPQSHPNGQGQNTSLCVQHCDLHLKRDQDATGQLHCMDKIINPSCT